MRFLSYRLFLFQHCFVPCQLAFNRYETRGICRKSGVQYHNSHVCVCVLHTQKRVKEQRSFWWLYSPSLRFRFGGRELVSERVRKLWQRTKENDPRRALMNFVKTPRGRSGLNRGGLLVFLPISTGLLNGNWWAAAENSSRALLTISRKKRFLLLLVDNFIFLPSIFFFPFLCSPPEKKEGWN